MMQKTTTKDETFQQLFKQKQDLFAVPKIGDILTGKILEITNSAIYIDLGRFGTGIVYGRELFDDLETFKKAKIGDAIQASVISLENEDGYIEMSLRSASRERSWEELKRKYQIGEVFLTKILDANRGGLIVRVSGIVGFIPVSQLAPEHYPRVEGGDKTRILERLQSLIGKDLPVKVIDVVPEEEKLIVSEKAAVYEKIKDVMSALKIGTIIEGTISGVVDFGAFVKFNFQGKDLEGLVHISELAWQRIDDPRDFVKTGDKIKAEVIGVDSSRISLSIKKLQKDPWLKALEKYKVGDIVIGEVVKINPFGAFVKLDKEIHGLAHISELTDKPGVKTEDILKTGVKKKFKIISIEPTEHRLGLSLKSLRKKAVRSSKPKERKTEKETKKSNQPKNGRLGAQNKKTKGKNFDF